MNGNSMRVIKLLSIFTGAASVKLIYNEVQKNSNIQPDELVNVHILARHGARTPMSLIHGLDEV